MTGVTQGSPQVAAETVCHQLQLTIWAQEIMEAIEPHIAPDSSYGDMVDLSLSIQRELKSFVEAAFSLAAETEGGT